MPPLLPQGIVDVSVEQVDLPVVCDLRAGVPQQLGDTLDLHATCGLQYAFLLNIALLSASASPA